MQAFLIRWFITTLAVMAAAWVLPGISYDTTGALIGASLLLGIINAFVRPVLLLLSLPFIIVTMGLFIFVVNALLLLLVSSLVPPFHVDGFGNAFFRRDPHQSRELAAERVFPHERWPRAPHHAPREHQAGECARD